MKKLLTFIIFFIMLIIWLSSCSRRVITQTVEHTIVDSVYVTLTPRDTTIYIPGDTVNITTYIECDSVTNKPKALSHHARAGRLSSSVSISPDGRLSVRAQCDSLEQIISVLDKEIFRLRHEKKTTVITKEKKPSRFRTFLNNMAWGLAILFLIYLALKFILKLRWL